MQSVALIDYGSGNLRSAEKALQKAAAGLSRPATVVATDDPDRIAKALDGFKGVRRFGLAYIPMDETLTRCALDLSNRPYLVWKVNFVRPRVGSMDTELFKEFHHAFAMNAGACIHLETLYGENSHHIAESGFKALARALRMAVEPDPKTQGHAPSTKGVL